MAAEESTSQQRTSSQPTPESVPFSQATNKEGGREKNPGLPRIRTYAADMSKAIKTRGETLATIVNTEKRAPRKVTESKEARSKNQRTILFAVGALLFVGLGIGAVVGVSVLLSTTMQTPQLTKSIIFPNRTIPIEVSDDVRAQLAEVRAHTDMSLGEVARIVVTRNGSELPPQELAAVLGLPPALNREIGDIMVGIHSFDRNQPFIILTINAYDRSFNALLTAETDLGRSLGSFFAPRDFTGEIPALTFEDAIIRNIDVRKGGPEWPMLYTYPERTTLVITTNEFTLREIVTRLSNQQP